MPSPITKATVHTKCIHHRPFDLPVFRWKFDEGAWRIDRPPALWHGDFPTYLYLKYPCESIKIRMDDPSQSSATASESVRVFFLRLTAKSWFNQGAERRGCSLVFPTVKSNSYHHHVAPSPRRSSRETTLGSSAGSFGITGKAEYYADIYYGKSSLPTKRLFTAVGLKYPANWRAENTALQYSNASPTRPDLTLETTKRSLNRS